MITTRVPVANVAFDDLTMPEAVSRIVQMAQKTGRPRFVCTGNLDHLVLLSRDAEFRQVYGGRTWCWPTAPRSSGCHA